MNSVTCPTDDEIITIIMSKNEARRIVGWINERRPIENTGVLSLLGELRGIAEENLEDHGRETAGGTWDTIEVLVPAPDRF